MLLDSLEVAVHFGEHSEHPMWRESSAALVPDVVEDFCKTSHKFSSSLRIYLFFPDRLCKVESQDLYVAETLQDTIHIATVAQVRKSFHSHSTVCRKHVEIKFFPNQAAKIPQVSQLLLGLLVAGIVLFGWV